MMKLYYSKGACSLASRIIIHELNLPSEFEAVNLKTKQTESGKDFLSINPKGYVPTIITSKGDMLCENVVVLQYLADITPNQHLLADMPHIDRYHGLEWLSYINTEIHKGFFPLFNPQFPQDYKESVSIPNLIKRYKYVNEQLQDKRYLMGEAFKLADAYLYVTLRWALHFKLDISDMQNLMRYKEELDVRPSVKKALAEEELV